MSEAEIKEKVENGDYEGIRVVRVQSRFRSWALWLSVIGALWTIASALGLPEKWGIQEGTFRVIVDSVGVILTAFGIMNNPTDPDNF